MPCIAEHTDALCYTCGKEGVSRAATYMATVGSITTAECTDHARYTAQFGAKLEVLVPAPPKLNQ